MNKEYNDMLELYDRIQNTMDDLKNKIDLGWIKCSDRLPTLNQGQYGDSEPVMVYESSWDNSGLESIRSHGIRISYARVSKKGNVVWMTHNGRRRPEDVKYWKPLPVPPPLENK